MYYIPFSTEDVLSLLIFTSGGMWYPYTWHASTTPSLSKGPKKFKFKAMPFPEETCEEDAPNPIGCKFELRIAEWFTNNTHIPGEPTLPEEMYDQWMHRRNRKNPWEAPGTAPVFGDGCGVNGGNPNGCGRGTYIYIRFIEIFIHTPPNQPPISILFMFR